MGLSLNYCWLYANLGALEGLDPVGLMRDMYLAHRLSKERAPAPLKVPGASFTWWTGPNNSQIGLATSTMKVPLHKIA